MKKDVSFPQTRPEQDQSTLWQLQKDLLRLAEEAIGPRDIKKIIYPPAFCEAVPHILHLNNRGGVGAVLSTNSKNYWYTAVYELAHETIHLLDPVEGYTNWLEEGVAVAFSLHAQDYFEMEKFYTPDLVYEEAFRLVMELPGAPFTIPKMIRSKVGALSSITTETLLMVAPNHPLEKLKKLCSTCIPN